MIVIGLSAKMGCGKSSVAEAIVAARGEKYAHLAFGNLLKQECAAYFDFPLEWCYSQEGKNRIARMPDHTWPDEVLALSGDTGLTVRQALQWYGTDFRRAQDPGYWIKKMREVVEEIREGYPDTLVIIDDVRFPGEAEFVLGQGLLFRIEPYPRWQPGPHAGHASETALDNFTRFTKIYRPGFGKDQLEAMAQDILNTVKE